MIADVDHSPTPLPHPIRWMPRSEYSRDRGKPNVQTPYIITVTEVFPICFVRTEFHTGLGSRPPGAPQVQRDGRRSAQREQRVLLLARRMADAAQTPRGLQTWPDHRHVGHQQRSADPVSHQVRSAAVSVRNVTFLVSFSPAVVLFSRYFLPLKLLLCFVIPIAVPVYAWNESWTVAIYGIGIFRYVLNLNFTWSVNSVAHIWGHKPFDKWVRCL